eukprot:1153388-Pelagomonas_calceolata.AAC.4
MTRRRISGMSKDQWLVEGSMAQRRINGTTKDQWHIKGRTARRRINGTTKDQWHNTHNITRAMARYDLYHMAHEDTVLPCTVKAQQVP